MSKIQKITVLAVLLAVGLFFRIPEAPAQTAWYSIHVSSFAEAAEADREASRLKARGLDAFVLYESVPGRGMWRRVYVGRFRTMAEAERQAAALKANRTVSYAQARLMTGQGAAPPPAGPSALLSQNRPQPPPQPQNETAPEDEVQYVGSYRDKLEAEEAAKTLKAQGWPAFVSAGGAQDVVWYRVYIRGPKEERRVPPVAPYGSPPGSIVGFADRPELTRLDGRPGSGAPAGFEINIDLSGAGAPLPPEYGCPGYATNEIGIAALQRLNSQIPNWDYQAALRLTGHKPTKNPVEFSTLAWGVNPYDRTGFAAVIDRLRPTRTISVLGHGLAESDAELAQMQGSKALIIISNFKRSRNFGDPLAKARTLAAKYGRQLCIYTIYAGADDEGVKLAQEIAHTSACGNFFDACLLLTDPAYLEAAVREIFYGDRVAVASKCTDLDRDGICDANDECPNTPPGAPVDGRGCWIAAFSQFFDFDKAVVKKKYLPRLKQAADILKVYPELVVTISGHTDNIGSEAYNLKLGRRRAEAVKAQLVRYGVEAGRLKVVTYGESRPIAPNDTDSGRAQNRRVEFNLWQSGAR